MKKVILIAGLIIVVIVILLIAGVFLMSAGPDIKEYEYLKSPEISIKPDQKMIVVETAGDPNTSGSRGLSDLFKMYYKLKAGRSDMKMTAPRARWPKGLDAARDQWIGIWAMPVPDDITKLPEMKSGAPVRLDAWEYGEVAEILHVGSYAGEQPTIDRLHKFIEDAGYTITGHHEEEYLKGPGMFIKGNPDKYLTIIRYRVKKK